MRNQSKPNVFCIRLSDPQAKKLQELSSKKGVTPPDVFRELIDRAQLIEVKTLAINSHVETAHYAQG